MRGCGWSGSAGQQLIQHPCGERRAELSHAPGSGPGMERERERNGNGNSHGKENGNRKGNGTGRYLERRRRGALKHSETRSARPQPPPAQPRSPALTFLTAQEHDEPQRQEDEPQHEAPHARQQLAPARVRRRLCGDEGGGSAPGAALPLPLPPRRAGGRGPGALPQGWLTGCRRLACSTRHT